MIVANSQKFTLKAHTVFFFSKSRCKLGHSNKAPTIPHHKLTVIVQIPLENKRQKSTRGCLNNCFNSEEKSLHCTSKFTVNMKRLVSQKIDRLERLYGGQVRCKLSNGTTI